MRSAHQAYMPTAACAHCAIILPLSIAVSVRTPSTILYAMPHGLLFARALIFSASAGAGGRAGREGESGERDGGERR